MVNKNKPLAELELRSANKPFVNLELHSAPGRVVNNGLKRKNKDTIVCSHRVLIISLHVHQL